MNPIFETAVEIQAFCHAEAWPFCVIGGLAVQRWGEPRLTQDVDVTILTEFGREETIIDRLLEKFSGRMPNAREFALQYRVLLLNGRTGIPIDVSLGAMPFEARLIARATDYAIAPPVAIRTCGAEDLVVLKSFAGRPQDWLDIEGIIARQAGRLDVTLIWRELTPLLELKEDTQSVARLRDLLVP